MKLSDIEERAEQKPFRPFALETTGGSWIDVEKQSDIFLPPGVRISSSSLIPPAVCTSWTLSR
jgi:hypothetical protein